MKRTIIFMALCLMTLNTFGADLFVRENGAGGAYATISEAIAAAVDGDRIIIKPKAGEIPYFENLIIDKSLFLVSEDRSIQYVLQGSIEIVPAINMGVSIQNVSLINNEEGVFASNGAPTGGRTEVTFVNSTIASNVSLAFKNVTTNLIMVSNMELTTISHGKVIGSSMRKLSILDSAEDSLANEDIYIIANDIDDQDDAFSTIRENIYSNTEQYALHIYNNQMKMVDPFGENIVINDVKPNSTNYIYNNEFDSDNSICIFINSLKENIATVEILNNKFRVGTRAVSDSSDTVISQAFFNIHDQNDNNLDFYYSSVDVTASNSYSASILTSGIDLGHPDGIYNDIDLTRNDVGVHGGSYAWDNFYPANADGKPQVYFLQLPNRVTDGSTIDVKAEAFSK